MARTAPAEPRLLAEESPSAKRVLTPDALAFLSNLHREFEPVRQELLQTREVREAALARGERPNFREAGRDIRWGEWKVAPVPDDLQKRHVEITGPVDRKMVINALNSGADCFMADFEDSLSPTWENVVEGQANLQDAVRRTIEFRSGDKEYRLQDEVATLLVRPRGWHLVERHLEVDSTPISASLFDFGLHLFHNGAELLERGSGPYFYLAKLEGRAEAALWDDVFVHAQDLLDIPRGSVKATVLIENVLAAFEMEEILWELRDHSSGLNAGRWDYIFSVIKKFRHDPAFVLPDRRQVTMTVPFMRAYTELLVRACHRRGAHAIGGMAAYIPSRRDPEVNERALAEVRADKERESGDGFDGTWVAHPDLVPVARQAFTDALGDAPHQKHRLREDVSFGARDLIDLRVPGGSVSRGGIANNVAVALRYLSAWLGGTGAVAIFDLMEDTATAEISRAQLWQWIRHGVELEDGDRASETLYREERDAELDRLREEPGWADLRLEEAAGLLDRLVLDETFMPFLTLPGYELLDRDTTNRRER